MQNVEYQHAYKHGKTIYLTFAGAEKFAQESRNDNAMRNKGAFLEALHTCYAALRATTSVDTSKPYHGPYVQSVQKKASLEGAALEGAALEGAALEGAALEGGVLTLVRQQRQEMELLMPVIRVRNEEEIMHIQNLKTARAEQLERQLEVQQKLNFEELIQKDALQERVRMEYEADSKHKDALQERVRVEREESLAYEQRVQQMAIDNEQRRNQMELEMERAKIRLEHDRRMLLDHSYKSAFLETGRLAQLPVASVVSIESVQDEPKSKRNEFKNESKLKRNVKAKVDISEDKKQANAIRAAKSAKTRRERVEALQEKKRLEYLAANVTNTSPEAVKARYEDLRIRCGLRE